jgi:hypothetical protein
VDNVIDEHHHRDISSTDLVLYAFQTCGTMPIIVVADAINQKTLSSASQKAIATTKPVHPFF